MNISGYGNALLTAIPSKYAPGKNISNLIFARNLSTGTMYTALMIINMAGQISIINKSPAAITVSEIIGFLTYNNNKVGGNV